MGRLAWLAVLVAVLACAAPAFAEDPPPEQPPPFPQPPDPLADETKPIPGMEVLSKPGAISRWAFVHRKAIVRVRPNNKARAMTRLKLKTEDGTDELHLLLKRFTDDSGRRWIQVRLPLLPNGRKGWVPQEALGGFHQIRTWLKIDRKRLRATLKRGTKIVFRTRIGIGQKQWPTPRGDFYIRDRLSGFGCCGVYGPLAFGLNARSSVLTDWPGGGFIGIHGTNQPGLIPGRPSHGCIRMRNRDILRLGRLMPVGTPVSIR